MIVPRVASIEIPVRDVAAAVEWYGQVLGMKPSFQEQGAAMLHFQNENQRDVPSFYLVKTEVEGNLSFLNTHTGIEHSVIDFYVEDLQRFHQELQQKGVQVEELNLRPDQVYGGFGFYDLNGLKFAVCNISHEHVRIDA
ncbi:hypothetical protein AB990_09570 [Alkalihalobacillus pseudalcaliphilus]|nr:hypothetical protein AB990_09570 [Alkalihalobacillus pseudalcaliphilus]